MQKSALFAAITCLLVAGGTTNASACSSFGRSDCASRVTYWYSGFAYGPAYYNAFVGGPPIAYGYAAPPPYAVVPPAIGYYGPPPPFAYRYYMAPPPYAYGYRPLRAW